MKFITKKIFTAMLAVCMVFTIVPVSGTVTVYADGEVQAGDTVTISPFVYIVIDPDEHTLMLSEIQNTEAEELKIHGSERYKGEDWQVKVVGDEYGLGNIDTIESIRTVIIEEGVEELSDFCFCGAGQIESIQLPGSLKTIGESAFNNTPGLTSIEIPNGVANLGKQVFQASGIQSIILPASLETIGELAFEECNSLTGVIIPEGTNSIGDYAFMSCDVLTDITLPDSVTSIGPGAFRNTPITSIELPGSLETIPNGCFNGCIYLESIEIPDSVTNIEEYAFQHCTVLQDVTLPENLESLGQYAFNNCDTFTGITIPDTVTGVPEGCFSGCKNLVSVVLPDTLETIDTAAFSDCYNLPQVVLPDGLEKLGYEAFSGCRALTEVAIPGSVSAIESEAFAMCDNLSRVVIEDGVKEIREGAFTGCTSLIEIVIPASVEIMDAGIFDNVDTDGFIIRAEEGSAAAEYAENIGTPVIGTDDVIISVSMDESRLTKYTTAFTEITASREAVSIAAVDPYSAGQFSINRDHSGLWEKENGHLIPADRTFDLDADKLYYICLALEPVGETVIPDEEKIAWRFNGKITETEIVQTGDNEMSVLFELNAPALAPAVTKYTVTVNNGAADPSEAAAGNEIALIASAPAGKVFREWTVDSGILPEGIDAYSPNTSFIMPENDIELTANYVSFIPAVGVHNICKTLEADCQAEFTAVVDEEYSDKVGIVREKWESADGTSVITNDQSGIPVLGVANKYSLILEAKDGFVFADNMTFCCDGQETDSTVTISENGTIAEITGIIPDVTVTRPIKYADVSEIAEQTYSGSPVEPEFTVSYKGAPLAAGTDYSLIYKDNTDVGTASAVITGIGAYSGTKTVKFTIAKAAQKITASASKTELAAGETTEITVKGAKGTKSFISSDTDVATVSSTGTVTAKEVGTVTITITAASTNNYNQGTAKVTLKVLPAATASVNAENLAEGIKVTWKKVAGATGYLVYCNGTEIKKITGGSTLTYTDKNANTNGTKYTYKITAFAGTGTSTVSKSVTVYRLSRPELTSIKNPAAGKMTVMWGGNAKSSGYQVQYSTSSTFAKENKTVSAEDKSTVSKTISNLTKGKIYYVRVRAYKTVSGKNYYSAWSPVKNVKIREPQNITVKASASAVAVGKTIKITATGAKGAVSYKSSDKTIAAVKSDGTVTAKKVGTVKITVTAAETNVCNKAEKTLTIKVVPAATSSFKAKNVKTGIKLTWKSVSGAEGYYIYRNGTKIKKITGGSKHTYSDTKATGNGTKYIYKIVAYASTGKSTLSKSVKIYGVRRPAISSLASTEAGSMTVKWAKNTKGSGYQIQYSRYSKFSSKKTVTVKGKGYRSKTITGLTKGKTYYVRVRTYKTVSGKKYYSAWSKAKSVTIAKK